MFNVSNLLVVKKLYLLALIAGFFIISTVPASAAELFSDSFEGDFSAWDAAGTGWFVVNNALGAHEGNYRAEGRGGVTTSVLQKYLNSAGYEDFIVSFWYQLPGNGFEAGESLTLAYTADHGDSWQPLATFTEGDEVDEWTEYVAVLPATAAGETELGIRFLVDAGSASDIFKLDAFSVQGSPIPAPDEDGDGVIEGDRCPNTAEDVAGEVKLRPNSWRYGGVSWVQGGSSLSGFGDFSPTMADTAGCSCDQIITIFQSYTGYLYTGHQKFGCSQGLLRDFIDFLD